MSDRTVIVPCFNEASRLGEAAGDELRRLADELGSVILVDDGSTDDTPARLAELAAHPRVDVVSLPANRGKAEAVRVGLQEAIGRSSTQVGFLDADLATPVDEYLRLSRLQAERGADAVLGSRVALAGREIDRRWARHYVGRIYATIAGLVLGREIYDTQCGAKVFAVTPGLRRALAEPFVDRWSFDVELIGRLLDDPDVDVVEEPLYRWAEVPGSKLSLVGSVGSTLSLFRVRHRLRRRPSAG